MRRIGPGPLVALCLVIAACGAPAASTSPSEAASSLTPPSETPSTAPAASVSPPASEAPTSAPPASPGAGTTYIVRAGDTLAAIARAYATTVDQLRDWNAERHPSLATDPNVIEPGWELLVSAEPSVTPRPATPRPT